jgi:hypothetical protein
MRNGVVVLDVAGAALPDGTIVSVEPLTPSPRAAVGSPKAVLEVAGTWHGDDSELARLLEDLRRDKWAEVEVERQR